MSLVELPETWIVLAAVLVLVAVALFVLSWRARRRARSRAGWQAHAGPSASASPAAPTPVHRGDDAVTGPVMAHPAEPAAVRDVATGEATPALGDADPARTGDRAKDRLLAVLLADPDGAVDVVAAMREGDPASGSAAASLLRSGLTPVQVARLCGVDEPDLADLIAHDLGLIVPVPSQGAERESPPGSRTGARRTTDPGRAWASAGSAPGSTTPTTG